MYIFQGIVSGFIATIIFDLFNLALNFAYNINKPKWNFLGRYFLGYKEGKYIRNTLKDDDEVKNDSVEVAETETPEIEVNHVGSMIDNLDAGDNVAAQDAFKNALTDKIGQALDDKRMTVANDWLNAGDDLQATQDAASLDKVGVETETTPEPVEIDQDQEVKQDEQPVVSEV